jgi:ribonuclease D
LLFDDDEECPLLHGWRFTMAGKELVGLLKGELSLGIEVDKISIIDSKHSC